MTRILRPYQMAGAAALATRKKLYLGDEPGLGKSCTALKAADALQESRVGVICPAIVRPHWWREADVMGVVLRNVASYNQVVDDEFTRESLSHCRVLIVDEAHFCKHAESQRTKAIFGTDGIARRVLDRGGAVWPLSGTPMPRNPAEMFPVLFSLWPKTLENRGVGTYMEYLNRFCVWKATRYGLKVLGSKNDEMLQEILGKVMLRRLLRDVASDLPQMRWGTVTLEPGDLAELLSAEAELSEDERALLRAGVLPPMSANIARFRHQIGDLKARAVAELLHEELSVPGAKRVVFCYHRSVLDYLQRELNRYGITRIDGDTNPGKREEQVWVFRNTAKQVFLGQISACGTGLDGLQYAANEALIVEPDWSRDVNIQAAKRIGERIGQTLPVQVRMVTLAPSLDEAIVKQFKRECEMVERIVG